MKQNLKLINGLVYDGEIYCNKDVLIEDGVIVDSISSSDYQIIDLGGRLVVPGFIDSHIHGALGSDTSDGNPDGILNMASYLASCGVCAFCPTTMSLSQFRLEQVLQSVRQARLLERNSEAGYAHILGVHLEGPMLSPSKAAAQDVNTFMDLFEGIKLINSLETDYPGLIRIISFAPELPGGNRFIDSFKDKYSLSLAHTDCDYSCAVQAFKLGADSVTHVLNAMGEISKRSPGVPSAAVDCGSYTEIICDGLHIEPPVLRILFKLIEEDKAVIISDAMRGAGMPDGEYVLGDISVAVRNNRTYFGSGGNLAGSVTNLASEYKVLLDSGIDRTRVIRAMTVNPLKRMRIDPQTIGLGYIRSGFEASVNIFDEDNMLNMSVVKGHICYSAEDK